MNVYVARQPILTDKKTLYGYELLFRAGMTNSFPDIDGDTATSKLLSSSFFTIGIDQISGKKLAFINFTEELLLKKYPTLFPKEKIMIEVLEDVNPTKEVVTACKELKEDGYMLALDDFVYNDAFKELVELADVVKIDFLLTAREQIQEMVITLKQAGCVLLAEKIEAHEDFMEAIQMGFSLFQGYFFSKPEIITNREIPSNQMTCIKLLQEVGQKDLDLDAVEELIHQELSISYKLLTYLNSVVFNRVEPVSSIRRAVAYLGEKGIRQFITLVAVSQLASEKSGELLRLSIIRAKFMEQLGTEKSMDSEELFMLGMFSLIDAMLDRDMQSLMLKLPISSTIKEALAEKKGLLYPFLRLVESYENGWWESFEEDLTKIGVDPEKIISFYMEAVRWADNY